MGDGREMLLEGDAGKVRIKYEKDRLEICEEPATECLIVEGSPTSFEEAKMLFSELGFKVVSQ